VTGERQDDLTHPTDVVAQQVTGIAQFAEFKLDAWSADTAAMFRVGEDIAFKFSLLAQQTLPEVVFAISIYRSDGDWLVGQTSREAGVLWPATAAGSVCTGRFALSPNCLAPGEYRAAMAAYSTDLSICYALTELAVAFSVRTDFPIWGKILHPCKWIPTDINEHHVQE